MAVEITKEQRDTIEYYNTHADEYCDATRNVDVSDFMSCHQIAHIS